MTESVPVQRFVRQYLQAEPAPEIPTDRALLRQEAVQNHLYDRLFSPAARGPVDTRLPDVYTARVLKKLTASIEASIDDWDADGVSGDLMDIVANFGVQSALGSFAVHKHRVVYTLGSLPSAPTITLLENRATIAAGGTTGIRTWEAAMHLGEYLCRQQPDLVRGRRVLELGAGTGFVSILCAKHLGAAHCVATDGSSKVVDNLALNLGLNGLGDNEVVGRELWWGQKPWDETAAFDIILGADITFDARDMPDLLATIRWCLTANRNATVLISATERNKATFDTFMQLASENGLHVQLVDFAVVPRNAQVGPFYSDTVPIHICTVSIK